MASWTLKKLSLSLSRVTVGKRPFGGSRFGLSKRAIAVSLACVSALVVPAVAQSLNNPTSYADGVNVRSNWSFTFGANARGPLGTVLRDPNVGPILKGSDRFALTVDGRLLGWPDVAGAAVVQLVDVVDFTHGGTNDNTELAVRADGTVWVRGQGNAGELGLGDARRAETITSFTQIPGLSGVVAVRAGDQSMFALDRVGRLWGWGSYDELSLPPLTPYVFRSVTSPTIIRTGVAEFDHAGRAGVVRKVDGSFEVFGGISGDDDFDAVMPLAFTSVSFGAVASFAASRSHVLLLRADGSLWEYGTRYSFVGFGLPLDRVAFTTPTRIGGLPAIKSVSVGSDGSTVALDRDGQVWAWGLVGVNDLGLLSSDLPPGSNTWINTPVRGLPGFGGWDKVWKSRQVTWIQKSNDCAPAPGSVVNVCGESFLRIRSSLSGDCLGASPTLALVVVACASTAASTDWKVNELTHGSFLLQLPTRQCVKFNDLKVSDGLLDLANGSCSKLIALKRGDGTTEIRLALSPITDDNNGVGDQCLIEAAAGFVGVGNCVSRSLIPGWDLERPMSVGDITSDAPAGFGKIFSISTTDSASCGAVIIDVSGTGLTAEHCLFEGRGKPYEKAYFVPGYRNSNSTHHAPFGIYRVTKTVGRLRRSPVGPAVDYRFFKFVPVSDAEIPSLVGNLFPQSPSGNIQVRLPAAPIASSGFTPAKFLEGPPRDAELARPWSSFGFPFNISRGLKTVTCAGANRVNDNVDCRATAGASGGPFLVGSYVRGVNARETSGLVGEMVTIGNLGKEQYDKYRSIG